MTIQLAWLPYRSKRAVSHFEDKRRLATAAIICRAISCHHESVNESSPQGSLVNSKPLSRRHLIPHISNVLSSKEKGKTRSTSTLLIPRASGRVITVPVG